MIERQEKALEMVMILGLVQGLESEHGTLQYLIRTWMDGWMDGCMDGWMDGWDEDAKGVWIWSKSNGVPEQCL